MLGHVIAAPRWVDGPVGRSRSRLAVDEVMDDPVVVDLRNLYHPADMRKAGLIYVGVGREACPRRTAIVSEAAE